MNISIVNLTSRFVAMLGSQAQKTRTLIIFILLIPCIHGEIGVQDNDAPIKTEIVSLFVPPSLSECENVTLICKVTPPDVVVWWGYQGRNVSEDTRYVTSFLPEDGVAVSTLSMPCVTVEDIGNYTCNVVDNTNETTIETKPLDVQVPLKVSSGKPQEIRGGSAVSLECVVKGHPVGDVIWRKGHEEMDKDRVTMDRKNLTLLHSTLKFRKVTKKDNGTYTCLATSPTSNASTPVPLFVLVAPQVNIDFVKSVGASRIFLNWTVFDGNAPIEMYFLQFMKNGSSSWTFNTEQISGENTSYVIRNLTPNTAYKIRLQAKNKYGTGPEEVFKEWVQTLTQDPDFVPEMLVKGVTLNSITIGWSSPPADIKDHVHYYELLMQNDDTKKEAFHSAYNMMNLYLFEELNSATTYHFKVTACSEFTRVCGKWSKEVNGTTLDGVSGPPRNVTVSCKFDNVSHNSFVYVKWSPPAKTNGNITRYNVILEGTARFKNERGSIEKMTWGPKVKSVNQDSDNARFDMIPANTNYTVKVSGVTRSRRNGEDTVVNCNMPSTVPDKDKLSRFNWGEIEEQGRWMFKLFMPRVSERNGPICCYRVVMIKMEAQASLADLPPPEEIPLFSYDEVHQSKKGGAYIAELFESDTLNSEVFLGDGITSNVDQQQCSTCFRVRPETTLPPVVVVSTEGSINIDQNNNDSVPLTVLALPGLPPPPSSPSPVEIVAQPLRSKREVVSDLYMAHVQDGLLDIDSNYTGFVQIIVFGPDNGLLQAYSSYFVPLKAGHSVMIADGTGHVLSAVLLVLLALIFIVFVVVIAIAVCLLQRYTKQVAEAQGVEMTLRNSFRHILCNKGYTEVELSVVCGRHLCQSLRGGRHVPVASSPPDMAPILRADMAAAYADRHRDSDYGFQHEFELLPDRFPDRTTRASEARENMYKNRYPDIKSYDQTRVKLSQVDGIAGSDYINANFVMGYKERKKFICAQGPMENTVSDFWRMIWEQHLELILMLTNLEEYSKTKCAKYWPDEGEKCYGEIFVTHIKEKRYSDYCIRELKMARTLPNKEKEERSIIQYHFLVWKDFMAPEHPSGILKFIKRMNEVYSLEKGPILVHCSAGVGRSGTLVALDSMTQQIQEEGEISVFNTVCDLRHQRNFLVQNLKQYIFIYRALVELAQYGDTEHKISKLKSASEKAKQRENGKEKCKLEEDFEKISRIPEESKPCSVASGDENRVKNKVESVIPYDRNRVILTPIPGKEHSTYINASFIEGYDNSESFIITQDPLEVTVADFWRMISEQCISTLVMLSDLGDGAKKCLRYWPDDEISHNHIKVKYIQSESCPYYTRREFSVTNCKTDETITVTQFQYNGWPTVEGEVPEVTRGLIELVDQTQAHQETQSGSGPITIHCNHGAERSSIFVALAILVQQIRTEKRVDIFTTTRKLRTQRQGMLQTYAQYEFLHRALVNYIDLHHLADEDV